MTASELRASLDGPTWARVEQFCAQQIDASKRESDKVLADTLASLAAEKTAHTSTINAAKEAIAKADAATVKAKSEGDAALAAYKAEVAAGIAAMQAAASDPKVDANLAVPEIIAKFTKPEREKRADAIREEIAAKQAELDAL